jgi:hypothetical protein
MRLKSFDISLSSSLCLSLSAYADCPVETGGSSAGVNRNLVLVHFYVGRDLIASKRSNRLDFRMGRSSWTSVISLADAKPSEEEGCRENTAAGLHKRGRLGYAVMIKDTKSLTYQSSATSGSIT